MPLRAFIAIACLLVATTVHATLPSSARSRAAEARVAPGLSRDLAARGLRLGAQVLLRIHKRERELEVWLHDGVRLQWFRTYPVCSYSGGPGPKQRTGDGQAPEGWYRVRARQLNPWSQYHLSFDLGYPNAFDRAWGRTGSALMVHGNCVSIGCYAMTDAGIEEIYTVVAAALRGGQASVPVLALPFRSDAPDATAMRADPAWGSFWSDLQAIDQHFRDTGREPAVRVSGRRYRLD